MESDTVADKWTLTDVSREYERRTATEAAAFETPFGSGGRAPKPRSELLSMVVGLVGLAALGASAWVYADTQRDIKRLATDIAQIRVSLELFGRQQASASPAAAGSDADLQALSNRLALLEANGRSAGATPAAALPAPTGQAAAGGDCLPLGTRFMMAAGDSYTVCGTTAMVSIAAVDNGYVTLGDGSIVAQGGAVVVPDTQCILGVMPAEGDGLSGYAEVRVTC